MPWNWDYERYNRDKDMIGFFYPEDLENIRQLDKMEAAAKAKAAKGGRSLPI